MDCFLKGESGVQGSGGSRLRISKGLDSKKDDDGPCFSSALHKKCA